MSLDILVTDDSAVMRAMIIRTLRGCGVALGDVLHASNGAEALEILELQRMDLALIDLNMPVMNGLELLEALARRGHHGMQVVVVSANGSEERIAAVRRYGAEFVRKPFVAEALSDAVRRAMGMAA